MDHAFLDRQRGTPPQGKHTPRALQNSPIIFKRDLLTGKHIPRALQNSPITFKKRPTNRGARLKAGVAAVLAKELCKVLKRHARPIREVEGEESEILRSIFPKGIKAVPGMSKEPCRYVKRALYLCQKSPLVMSNGPCEIALLS